MNIIDRATIYAWRKTGKHRALLENTRSLSLVHIHHSNWINKRKVEVELSWSGKTHISHLVVKQGSKQHVATFRLVISCQTGSSLRAYTTQKVTPQTYSSEIQWMKYFGSKLSIILHFQSLDSCIVYIKWIFCETSEAVTLNLVIHSSFTNS